jgi:hypothetical protein
MCHILINCIVVARKVAHKVQLHWICMYVWTCILTPYIHVAYVMSRATGCRVQLVLCNYTNLQLHVSHAIEFSCKQQLQNPKFLVVFIPFLVSHVKGPLHFWDINIESKLHNWHGIMEHPYKPCILGGSCTSQESPPCWSLFGSTPFGLSCSMTGDRPPFELWRLKTIRENKQIRNW